MEQFKMRLNALLKLKGMSQRDLAEKTGMTIVSISRYCTGKRVPKANDLLKIADGLDTSVGYLMGEDEKAPEGYIKISDIKEFCDKAAEVSLQCRSQEWDVFKKQYNGGAVQLNDLAKACTFFESRYCMYKFDIPGMIDAIAKGDWREEMEATNG